jgi:hypothetical protein
MPFFDTFLQLLRRLRLNHRLAALGVVGVLLCTLPLLLLLRVQGAVLTDTRAAEAALDPLMLAVTVQRALVQHRDLAGAVLRGAVAREPERRQRQTQVDGHVNELGAGLRREGEPRAQGESDALRRDWIELSRRVEERSVAAADSDAGHRLLVEQTLQVIDYITLSAGLGGGGPALAALGAEGEAGRALAQGVAVALPRLGADIGLLLSADPTSSATHPREIAARQQRLAAALAALPAVGTPLAPAVAALQSSAEHYFSLQRDSAEPRALAAAAQRLQADEWALYQQAHAALATLLADRRGALQVQRIVLLLSLATLALVAAALLASVWPPAPPGASAAKARVRPTARRRFNAADPTGPDSDLLDSRHGNGSAPGQAETGDLLARLRTAAGWGSEGGARSRRPSHTLPPRDD